MFILQIAKQNCFHVWEMNPKGNKSEIKILSLFMHHNDLSEHERIDQPLILN